MRPFYRGGILLKDYNNPAVYGGDVTAPRAVLTTDVSSPVSAAFTVTATFYSGTTSIQERVTGVSILSFVVTNGTPSNFVAVSDSVYTITVTPDWLHASVIVNMPAGVAQDLSGNLSTAAIPLTRTQSINKRVLITEVPSHMGYWRLAETSGTDALDSSANGFDGTHSGTLLNNYVGPDGGSGAPLFDGLADVVDLISSGAAAVFNGAAGTLMIWFKVANAAVWTDGASRYAFIFYRNGSNYIIIQKPAINNQLTFYFIAGGVTKSVTVSSYSPTGWVCAAMTWDTAAGASGEMKAFLDGAQTGTTQTNLGTWSGAPTVFRIGGSSAASFWYGGLSDCALWTKALTPAQIAAVGTV